MTDERFSRTALILGDKALEQTAEKRVAVFGAGGVGGYVIEGLARMGIGTLDIIDNDTVVLSNLNRQIIATEETLGQCKVDAAEERIHLISPATKVNKYKCFYLPKTSSLFDFSQYDYVVDAVDTVTAKIDIILQAEKAGVPVISAMGCGNRIDPSKLILTDIYETKGDPLAKVMRYELRRRGIKKLCVVYSTEPPLKHVTDTAGSRTPGSTVFVPASAGLLIASKVTRDLISL